MPRGYIALPQWYCDVRHIEELVTPKTTEPRLDGCTRTPKFTMVVEQPRPRWGEIILRVEDDGQLTLVADNCDSSG